MYLYLDFFWRGHGHGWTGIVFYCLLFDCPGTPFVDWAYILTLFIINIFCVIFSVLESVIYFLSTATTTCLATKGVTFLNLRDLTNSSRSDTLCICDTRYMHL